MQEFPCGRAVATKDSNVNDNSLDASCPGDTQVGEVGSTAHITLSRKRGALAGASSRTGITLAAAGPKALCAVSILASTRLLFSRSVFTVPLRGGCRKVAGPGRPRYHMTRMPHAKTFTRARPPRYFGKRSTQCTAAPGKKPLCAWLSSGMHPDASLLLAKKSGRRGATSPLRRFRLDAYGSNVVRTAIAAVSCSPLPI